MQKEIIMAPPDYFSIDYELSTNPLMRLSTQPHKTVALSQWRTLKRSLEEKNVRVHVCPSPPDLPDFTFFANAGLPLPWEHGLILSNFYHPERRKESPHHSAFFRNHFTVYELPPDAFFEGQGDAFFWDENTLFICCGIRTNQKGVTEVTNIIRRIRPTVRVIPLAMQPNRGTYNGNVMSFYHGDMCLMPLRRANTFFVYPRPFIPSVLETLARYGTVIHTTKREAHHFSCNGCEIAHDNVLTAHKNNRMYHLFKSMGYHITVPVTQEFWLSGGGPKCLILELEQPLA